MRPWVLGVIVSVLCSFFWVGAQNPKEGAKKAVEPKILLVDRWPLAKPWPKDGPKLTLRGMALESIEKAEALSKDGKDGKDGKTIALKIGQKEKSAPPANREALEAGDSQIELQWPNGSQAPSTIRFHSKGLPKPVDFAVTETPLAVQNEKEPNGGFEEAQKCLPGQLMLGSISPVKDVDVFALQSPKGSRTLFLTGPKGPQMTLLRPYFMLHNAQGDLVKAFEWDRNQEMGIPWEGGKPYFLSIIDQLDSTSGFHHYAFQVEFR